MLGVISYRDDPGFWMKRWFFDSIFHVLVVIILRNLFLGVILEAFVDLRNKNYFIENDIKNICFICQISRDSCISQSKDFDEHISKEHNTWNYVYFLMSLHLGGTENLSQIKREVWDKIGKQDFSWIPSVNS